MITIVPAAGNSQRFKDAGYDIPKQFLKMPKVEWWATSTYWMIDRVLAPIPSKAFIIARNGQHEKFDLCEHVIFIDNSTGPLDTALQGLTKFRDVYPDQDVLIVYSDVIFGSYSRFLHKAISSNKQASAIVFKSSNPRFGYFDDKYAFAGIFYFASFNDFISRAYRVNKKDAGIPSVIETYAQKDLYLHIINESERFDLGTPEDYESYMAVCREVE